jgi:hypothetical protein
MGQPLNDLFVNYAAEVLADTTNGLSGPNIVKVTGNYALEHGVTVPHQTYPFQAANKKTALAENLKVFDEPLRFRIIKDLAEHPEMPKSNAAAVQQLKARLIARHGHLAGAVLGPNVNEDLVEQTKHWLQPFPDSLKLYNQALDKYKNKIFLRNVLDDLRVALERLVQDLVGNGKSLENQEADLGSFIKAKGGSPELRNMFQKLLDYYCKYQNTYVKHDDAVIEEEVEFVLEISSAFMKHLVRLS